MMNTTALQSRQGVSLQWTPRQWTRITMQISSLLICVVFWHLASTYQWDFGFIAFTYVPTPIAVADAAWHLVNSNKLLPHLGSSLYRVFVGYFSAVLMGVALGLLIGRSRRVESFLLPPLEV